jgi:hypothetical protein
MTFARYYYVPSATKLTKQSKRTQLLLAKSHFEEAHRVRSKIYGPTHPHATRVIARLAPILELLNQLSQDSSQLG